MADGHTGGVRHPNPLQLDVQSRMHHLHDAMQTATARGLTGGEIVNDDSKKARVEVSGTVNGKQFAVERIVGR